MADEKYRLENHTAAELDEMLGKVGELYTKDELDELIAAKADQSALDELETDVGNKADQSALDDLEVEVDGKATMGDVYGSGVSLVSGTDLNDITEEGTYYTTSISVTGTLLNAPFTANRIKLLVFRISTNAESSLRCTQILLPQSSTIGFFIRHCVNGTWANWIQYSDVVASVSGLGINITENADLNDYTTPGIYQCPTTTIAGTLTNSPVSATNTFRMEVKTLNTSAVLMQTVYPLGGTEFYIRKYRSSGWQPWYKFAGEAVT